MMNSKIVKWIAVAFQIAVHLGAVLPLVWLWVAIPAGALGGDPVKELIHFLGIGALRLLLLCLCVSPAAKIFKIGFMLKLRRPLGLWCFVWASLHLTIWMWLDLGLQWSLIGEELVMRTYIVVGFLAWVMLLILAITSVPHLMRRLGKSWKKLHTLIYLIAALGCLHFWWSLKSGWIEPVIYSLMFVGLIWWRRRKIIALVGAAKPKNIQ